MPDWFQVDFAGTKTIDEIDVFSLHDNYTEQNMPTETQTFSLYGLVNFEVRKFTFAPITTSPSEPTEAMTFSAYGLTGYDVQYWTATPGQLFPAAASLAWHQPNSRLMEFDHAKVLRANSYHFSSLLNRPGAAQRGARGGFQARGYLSDDQPGLKLRLRKQQ